MLRLDQRSLSDPNEIDPPVRKQVCAVDDARRLLIQWTEEGTWCPAGEQGFQYTSREATFAFIANVGGDSAEEGRPADGRIFVLLNGLADRCAADAGPVAAAAARQIAADIEAAMTLWPDLVPVAFSRRVYFWFPDRHPTRYRDWGSLGRLFGVGQPTPQAGDDADVAWLRNRVWRGSIA